ncbi:hypothetical protein B0T18DRAFT_89950 [Schizothecium vesticola]|uniref:Uncharacterized protein n=1 Tax=Schizothecium vesticola TaxID=314040 RepID=A0AA40KAX7_9PEZI|nr:hypothetical protein B0T18DRAFT_89950 [Schizothecium vesticola]
MPNMSESLASWRTSDRERRQDLVWSDLALVPYHALAPAPALFTSLPGAGAIGEISQASIPHDLSHTHRISRGLEARRCLPWHPATTTTGARKDLYVLLHFLEQATPRYLRTKKGPRVDVKMSQRRMDGRIDGPWRRQRAMNNRRAADKTVEGRAPTIPPRERRGIPLPLAKATSQAGRTSPSFRPPRRIAVRLAASRLLSSSVPMYLLPTDRLTEPRVRALEVLRYCCVDIDEEPAEKAGRRRTWCSRTVGREGGGGHCVE